MFTTTSPRRHSSPLSRIVGPQHRKYIRPVAFLTAIAFCFWLLGGSSAPNEWGNIRRFDSVAHSTHSPHNTPEAHEFLDLFSYALHKGKPTFEVKFQKNDDGKDMDPGWHMWDPKTKDDRLDILDISPADKLELTQNHKAAVLDFGKLSPKLPFVKGTRGIVMTAGNDAYPILTTSLRMLRNAGSTLPVEILVGSYNDYEKIPCETIFPPLDAKCIVMDDFLPEHMTHKLDTNSKFEFKTYSIIFSSFEQVLFLDCDLFPVMNPDPLFMIEPFLTHGWVLWPDYWASTTSRHYYEMLDRTPPSITDRASTESGALIINKRTHAAALLLAHYYNHWGDKHYYHLFSQGATGFGDKDTFIPAIEAFNLPFYQVHERPERLGYRCEDSRRAVGTGQAHPYDDWLISTNEVYRDLEEDIYIVDAPEPRVMFIHGNLPKLDFPLLLEWSDPVTGWLDMLRCNEGKGSPHRMWGPKELTVRKFGWDVEKAAWDAMRWCACEHEFDYRIWVNGSWHSTPRENVCSRSVAFYNELFPNEPYDPTIKPLKLNSLTFGFQWPS